MICKVEARALGTFLKYKYQDSLFSSQEIAYLSIIYKLSVLSSTITKLSKEERRPTVRTIVNLQSIISSYNMNEVINYLTSVANHKKQSGAFRASQCILPRGRFAVVSKFGDALISQN